MSCSSLLGKNLVLSKSLKMYPISMARSYPERIIKILYGESGNLCPFPGCKAALIEDNHVVSQIAHILPVSKNGPRAVKETTTDLNSPDNLMPMCLKHHKIIDDSPSEYPVETLREWKTKHVALIKDSENNYVLTDELAKAIAAQGQLTVQINGNTESSILTAVQNTTAPVTINSTTNLFQLDSETTANIIARNTGTRTKRLTSLLEQMKNQVTDDQLIEALKDPSEERFISESLATAQLTDEPDIYKIIAQSVKSRITSGQDSNSRKDVAFSQVPVLISQLTLNQMKIIAVSYLATNIRVNINGISFPMLDAIIAQFMNPIGRVEIHPNDLGHISGTSAGSYMSFWENKAFPKAKEHYEHLFIMPVAIESVEASAIDDEFKNLYMNKAANGYSLKMSLTQIEQDLLNHPDLTGINSLKPLVDMSRMSDEQAMSTIHAAAPSLGKVIDIQDNTSLNSLQLSLPGKALAIAVLEGYIGSRLDQVWETDEKPIIFE